MIVDIKKGSYAKGLIEYHEKKVERGRGERILDTTFSTTKEQRISRMMDITLLNKSVRKNKFLHLSISFNAADNVSREQQLQIADLYLEEMGYGLTPRLVYEHWDAKHRHFHIVTTTIDLDGKKVPEFKDFERSQLLSRRIEKQFGLKITKYERKENAKLQELNSRKFRLVKGFEKIFSNDAARLQINKILPEDDLKMVLADKWNDARIREHLKLRENGQKKFNDLYRILRLYDAEYKTDKEMLRERLTYIKEISVSRDDFMAKVEAQGIYVRKIATGDNTSAITYGIAEKNFYLTDKDLPLALRYDYLFTRKKVVRHYDRDAQQRFLRRMVNRQFNVSSSLEEFELKLRDVGVKFEYSTNRRGIYGITFSSENLKEPFDFKGSELGLSWNTITEKFRVGPAEKSAPDFKGTSKEGDLDKGSKIVVRRSLGNALDTSPEDEDEKKRKRKERGGEDLEPI